MKIIILLSLATGLLTTQISCAQRGAVTTVARPAIRNTGQILGTTVVNFKTERDVIRVTGADIFRQLKFRVTDAAIEILDIDVIYENGAHDDIRVRQVIQRGGESRIIDLRGASRRIQRISFVYRSVPGFRARRAKLTVVGIK
ncbi:MAG: hypothetical protein H7Z72_23670 [Bacteroidetes bacterium]|nr:hypothetical protein [Fibrella sp.]